MIGLCISAMSFTGILSALVFGRVTDYIGKTKVAVIIADIFAIGGGWNSFVLMMFHFYFLGLVPKTRTLMLVTEEQNESHDK